MFGLLCERSEHINKRPGDLGRVSPASRRKPEARLDSRLPPSLEWV
jgi:hypothetical protein